MRNKKKYITLERALIVIVVCSVIFSFVSLNINLPKLHRLKETCYEQTQIYEERMKEQKRLKSVTEDEKKILAEEKAREDGYSLPNDIIFYDVS